MNGLSSFFKNIKFTSLIGTVNKTLNITKKAIPVYKEIRPLLDGKKTIFKKNEIEILKSENTKENKPKENNYNDNLTFFQ